MDICFVRGVRNTRCTKYEQRISSTKGFSRKSIDGSNNFKSTRIYEHEESEPHKTAKRCKEYDEAKERGETYRLDIPTDAPIAQGFKRMRQTESEGPQRLFDVAYYVANTYRVRKITRCFFSRYEIRKQKCLSRLRTLDIRLFISSGRQRESITSKYYCDPNRLMLLSLNKRSYISYIWILTTSFHDYRFLLSELHQGQDAAMLKSAIVNAFTENNMEDALTKIVFFWIGWNLDEQWFEIWTDY